MKKILFFILLFVSVANAQYNKTFQQARCSADTANATTSLIGTPLQFYVAANSTYSFQFNAPNTSSATTGGKYTLYYPSGGTIRYSYVGTKKLDTLGTDVGTTDSTASVAFNTNASGTGQLMIQGTIATGSTRGIVMLEFVKPTSGTLTILKGAYCKAQKF